jgi:hypothetical protein
MDGVIVQFPEPALAPEQRIELKTFAEALQHIIPVCRSKAETWRGAATHAEELLSYIELVIEP